MKNKTPKTSTGLRVTDLYIILYHNEFYLCEAFPIKDVIIKQYNKNNSNLLLKVIKAAGLDRTLLLTKIPLSSSIYDPNGTNELLYTTRGRLLFKCLSLLNQIKDDFYKNQRFLLDPHDGAIQGKIPLYILYPKIRTNRDRGAFYPKRVNTHEHSAQIIFNNFYTISHRISTNFNCDSYKIGKLPYAKLWNSF